MNKTIQSLLKFIDLSPSAYHASEQIAKTLSNIQSTELKENEDWQLKAGKAYHIIRADASIIAFRLPRQQKKLQFHIIGAHTDSPCLQLKPNGSKNQKNYQQWNVETYGGVLLNSWLNRDLQVAGRVTFIKNNKTHSKLIHLTEAKFCIPQLAIHLHREIYTEGLKLNKQQHLNPVISLESKQNLLDIIQKKIGSEKITHFDLFLTDSQPSSCGGSNNEFIYAPRLDNLAMCHAGLSAFCETKNQSTVSVIAFFNHEEVGSSSNHGAGSDFLQRILERITYALSGTRDDYLKSLADSFLISADMAHAVHPNYPEKHDSQHMPEISQGPVIKANAQIRYATNAETATTFASLCQQSKVKYQQFVMRSDLGCGSTIGPILASQLGISSVDVGNPMLSMHAIREMAGTKDHTDIIKVFHCFFKQ